MKSIIAIILAISSFASSAATMADVDAIVNASGIEASVRINFETEQVAYSNGSKEECVVNVSDRVLRWSKPIVEFIVAHELGHCVNNDGAKWAAANGKPSQKVAYAAEFAADAFAAKLMKSLGKDAKFGAMGALINNKEAGEGHPSYADRMANITKVLAK